MLSSDPLGCAELNTTVLPLGSAELNTTVLPKISSFWLSLGHGINLEEITYCGNTIICSHLPQFHLCSELPLMKYIVVNNFTTSCGVESNDFTFPFCILDCTPLFSADSKFITYLIKI